MTTRDFRDGGIQPRLYRARLAVGTVFLTNGAIFANLIPRYPEIKSDLGLSNVQYGLAIAAFPAGALIAGLSAGAAIRRFGSRNVAVGCTALISLGIFSVGLAPTGAALTALLLVTGGLDAITDVAQNAHGLRVQHLYRRSLLNGFHAVWSVGAVMGGLMGAAAVAMELPRGLHLALSGSLFIAIAGIAWRWLLPGSDATPVAENALATSNEEGSRRDGIGWRRVWVLAALALIAIANSIVEDSGNSWAALYLSTGLGAESEVAALGFVALASSQFLGRLFADRAVDRFGKRATVRAGGALIAAGMSAALAWPNTATTILGFGVAGLGSAPLVPAALAEADERPEKRHGANITLVSWLLRIGFLVTPPIIGLVSQVSSIRVALLIVPISGLAVLLLAPVLSPRLGVIHGPSARREG